MFEGTFSIDDQVRSYKPARAAYLAVARAMRAAPEDLCLVSYHAFDALGAAASELKAALVLRRGNAPIALRNSPAVVGPDLTKIAADLIAGYTSR